MGADPWGVDKGGKLDSGGLYNGARLLIISEHQDPESPRENTGR